MNYTSEKPDSNTSLVLCKPIGTGSSGISGWVTQPEQRGSIDIIWSCLATLFVCVWVMIHLNVPAHNDSNWTLSVRRTRWLLLAILAPELVMLFASGQWASAKQSVSEMKALGFESWSMVHAFYADSGGFVLQARDSTPFPITAKQIQYLVVSKYMPLPAITRAEIWDKSKADRFAKYVASLQAGWLVLQVVARAVQHLPITLLELSTVALITCTAATFYFWFCTFLTLSTWTILELIVPQGSPSTSKHQQLSTSNGLSQRSWWTQVQEPVVLLKIRH